MTKIEAQALLDADKEEFCLDGWDYFACVEELLPNHARLRFRLAFNQCRIDDGNGVRAATNRALQRCRREAGEVYAVGNAQGWRAR